VGEGDAQVMHAILNGQFTPPSRIIRGYPAELEQIVLTAMSADPTKRFTTAERMRTSLEEFLARSGPIVTEAQVGAFVHQRVGNVLDRRRDRIRAAANAPNPDDISGGGNALAGGTPSAPARGISGVHARGGTPPGTPAALQMPAASDATGPSIVAALATRPPSRIGKYVLVAAIGVIIAAGIGSGVIIVMRNRAADDVRIENVTPPKATATSAPEHVMPTPSLPSPSIELRGLPADAVLYVSGEALGPSVRVVPRPGANAVVEVVIKAPGFADETVKLDETTPSSLEVALTLQSPDETPNRNTTTTASTATPRSTSTGSAPAPSRQVALPENPY
jgi:hypothetical protein